MTKRARGGAFGGTDTKETNGKREGGHMIKINPSAKVMKVGSKTSSSGFAAGGATDEDNISRNPSDSDDKGRKSGGMVGGEKPAMNFAKRARGGAAFSAAGSTSDRQGSSSSGHEGE